MKSTISYEDFAKLDLRVGEVKVAAPIPESTKLIKLSVNFGEDNRTIFAGLAGYFLPEYFQGKRFIFVYNLASRAMMGGESQGMILAADCAGSPKPIEAPEGSQAGDTVK